MLRYQDFIKEKKLKVSLFCDENLKVNINKEFLVEIIDPLIRNAIIYNKKEGKIVISCEKKDGDFIVEIKDTGIGMTGKQVQQVFVPFVQFIDVEHYKTHKLKGLGLGLAMCKKLVEMVKGDLTIESEKEVGTTVKVLIPERV